MLVTTGLNTAGVEFQWQSLAGLPGDQVNRHSLPLTRYATTGMNAISWGVNCINIKVFHRPGVTGLWGDSIINAMLLYYIRWENSKRGNNNQRHLHNLFFILYKETLHM